MSMTLQLLQTGLTGSNSCCATFVKDDFHSCIYIYIGGPECHRPPVDPLKFGLAENKNASPKCMPLIPNLYQLLYFHNRTYSTAPTIIV